MAEEMVVFTRCFDLLAWLLPKAEKFPRAFRSTATQRLMDAALDVGDTHNTQANVVVAIVRIVVVAVRRARVVLIVVPGPAAQHAPDLSGYPASKAGEGSIGAGWYECNPREKRFWPKKRGGRYAPVRGR